MEWITFELQQHLPFTVLKPSLVVEYSTVTLFVATALTVYGIETRAIITTSLFNIVATALTVYGIETRLTCYERNLKFWLQQHLPFTVLKLSICCVVFVIIHSCNSTYRLRY